MGYVGRREKREVDGQRDRGRGETGAKEGRKRDTETRDWLALSLLVFFVSYSVLLLLSLSQTLTRALSLSLSLCLSLSLLELQIHGEEVSTMYLLQITLVHNLKAEFCSLMYVLICPEKV